MEFKNKKLQSPRGSHSAKRRAQSENKTQKKPNPSRGSHSAERRAHSDEEFRKQKNSTPPLEK